MSRSGRIITDVELCDIVMDNTLTVQASWTSLIIPGAITADQLEDLIYTRGVHLEDRVRASQFEKISKLVTFPTQTPGSVKNERLRLLTKHVTTLTAALNINHH
jgi:hypothetical protein